MLSTSVLECPSVHSLCAAVLKGCTINADMKPSTRLFFVQATLRRNPAPDLRQDANAMAQVHGGLSFEEGQHVLFLGTAHYGCLARVLPAQYAGLNQQVGSWCVEECLPEIQQTGHASLIACPFEAMGDGWQGTSS